MDQKGERGISMGEATGLNFKILLSLLPVVVFVYLTRVAPPWVAILGGVSASGVVLALARRDRLVGALTLFGFSVALVAGAIGIAKGSERAYLAAGPVSDFLFVPLYAVSILRGRPLVGGIARELVPVIAARLPADAPLYRNLSVAWASFDVAHGLVATFLLSRLSVTEYVVWSRLLLWPFAGALLVFTAAVIWHAASRAGEPAPLGRHRYTPEPGVPRTHNRSIVPLDLEPEDSLCTGHSSRSTRTNAAIGTRSWRQRLPPGAP
jgi:intracellular septation protein A